MPKLLVLLVTLIILSGCMYPQSERVDNQIPPESQIEMVQRAVDQYQDTHQVLPIKTLEDRREYLKYQVEFNRLVPNYISERPSTSFEAGGKYQYVIVNEESNPEVKIADLSIAEEIRSLQLRIQGMGPHVELDEQVGPNVYALDLEYYNLDKNPTVTSPYTNQELNVYYSGGQEFVVDYRSDVTIMINDNDLTFETGEDVREVLYMYTPVVPIFSPELTVDENGDVVFMTSHHKE